MSDTVIWLPPAMASYRRLRVSDPDGAKRIAGVIAALADDPDPPHSYPLGGTAFRRIRLDHYRILYEVGHSAIQVMHVGRVT
jgi:mRNA-degrading endonuclease RelE of RelBE toxin-antitoxin system